MPITALGHDPGITCTRGLKIGIGDLVSGLTAKYRMSVF
jgi:hypothetical protein